MLRKIKSLIRSEPSVPSEDLTRNRRCAEFEVDAWALSQFVLEKLVPVVGVHPFPLHELMLMAGAACRCRPTLIFEWGTHIGKSARVFYETISHYGIQCQIHSVDLPDDVSHVEHPSDQRGRMVRGLQNVHLHQGDGLSESLRLWQAAGGPSQVLFFVDGDHSRDSVYRELAGIAAAVPSAHVLLHDSFYQSAEAGYNVGPHEAIEQVLRETAGRYGTVRAAIGLPGMTLLYPRAR